MDEKALKQFMLDMNDEIRNESYINYSDITSEFLKYYTTKLISADEILEFEEYDIEFVHNRVRVRIDGYFQDRFEQSITLFVADFEETDEITTLTNTRINDIFNRVKYFLDAVYSNRIMSSFEESSAAYQLASEIISSDKITKKIHIFILSNSVLSNRVKKQIYDTYRDKYLDVSIWDLVRVYNLVQSSMRREDLEIEFSEFKLEGISCIKAVENKKYTSYLAVIEGKTLADLYIKYGPRLLEGNVRSFLSVRGKINKGIRNTIRNEPDIFFVYNNGIACTATDAEIEEQGNYSLIKKLTNFQIINGGQTTASIANAILQDRLDENVESIRVPMKLTILNKNYYDDSDSAKYTFDTENYKDLSVEEKKERFIDDLTANIARYANSQNKVDASDFFSNHPYHVRMQELSMKNYAPPSHGNVYETIWYYERAKGQYEQLQMKLTKAERKRFAMKYPKNQLIKKIDLAKYVMTYQMRPDIVSRGNQVNMRYFADDIEIEWRKDKDHSSFNAYYYKKCIALAILYKETEKLVSASQWYKEVKSYRANVVTYSIASLFYMISKYYTRYELNFIRIWNEQKLYDELIAQLGVLAPRIYKQITKENRGVQNVTEWCKKEACWSGMKSLMDNNKWTLRAEFVRTLVSKEDNRKRMSDQKRERKELDGINYQVSVINVGEDYWKRALSWDAQMRVLNEVEQSFLRSATDFSKHVPSERQCAKIMKIHQKLIEEGFR